MSLRTTAMLFTALCLIAATFAHFKSIELISVPEPQDNFVVSPRYEVNKEKLAALQKTYKDRPLFTSKSGADLSGPAVNIPQTAPSEWSPLDYQLIGVSSAGGTKTGWFKHIETGALLSARQGTNLGAWQLDNLLTSEARLSFNGENVSLKLFQGGE